MDNFVIAVTRTCGSGATTICKMLCEDLEVSLYDRNLLRLASDDSGINEAMFASVDEHIKNSVLYRVSKKVYNGELIPPESNNFKSDENLYNYQAKVLKELTQKESYVCIGRGAGFVLKDYPNLLRIFIYAPLEERIKHEASRLKISQKEAEDRIKKTDKFRSEYYHYHTGLKWGDPYNYDLCINTGSVNYEQSVELIKSYMEIKGMLG